jgi:hypothetical protein
MTTLFKISPLLILFFIVTPLIGQNHSEKYFLDWHKITIYDEQIGNSKEIPFFENAVLKRNCLLPVFQKKVPVLNKVDSLDISLLQVIYEAVPDYEIGLIDMNSIQDTIQINQQIGIESKQKYIIYSFIPFRKNKLTGEIEKLFAFVVNIKEVNSGSLQNKLKSDLVTSNTSILSTGDWYKIKISKSGVYQIYYEELVDLGLSNPENARIYGHNGSNLPITNNGIYESDPVEIPIMIFKGGDDVFGSGDYILFYAEGSENIRYNSTNASFYKDKNIYNNQIAYFITSNPGGKRINLENISLDADTIISTYDYLEFHEKNEISLIKSGKEFVGERFKEKTTYEFNFDFTNLIPNSTVELTTDLLARSKVNTTFNLFYNNQLLNTIPLKYVNVNNNLDNYASQVKTITKFSGIAGNNLIKIEFNNNYDTAAIGWLNSILLKSNKYLKYNTSQLIFKHSRSVKTNRILQYHIENATNQLQVWDITDIHNVKQMETSMQAGTISYKADASVLKNYIVFNSQSNLLRPVILKSEGKITNQNLHNLENIDYLIVAHPAFKSQADELANIHTQKNSLRTKVVTTIEIFNEFSSGNSDPAAIRNFVKYLYDKAPAASDRVKYLLLFGDCSYDPRNVSDNYILSYQSDNSIQNTESYVSDDYFGILDNNEAINGGILDIAVGRFPVKSSVEANAVVHKIRAYLSNNEKTGWTNKLCFLADDDDNNIHVEQLDQIAKYVGVNYPFFNVEKIYLDAFKKVKNGEEESYPDAELALLKCINEGSLVFNFIGHGNTSILTFEKVIQQKEDVQKWTNTQYPLFILFTCEFSRFDQSGNSGGEDILLNNNGGGIATISASRLTYSGPNYVLNYQFNKFLTLKDVNGSPYGIGEILRLAKNNTGSDINKLNYSLLGDPALKLAFPKYTVQTDSICGKETGSDTLKAFQTVTIAGKIIDGAGNKISNFNGTLLPLLYDMEETKTTLSNNGEPAFKFASQNNILFRGKATIKNGEFKFSFMVPGIDSIGNGKLSYYAFNDSMDATGYYENFILDKRSLLISDNKGPKIDLFINDSTFANGNNFANNSKLIAYIEDDNEISIGNFGLGHDITAYIDSNLISPIVLNSYFICDIDNYKKGKLVYTLPVLKNGSHNLVLKAWDIFNNYSTKQINFNVDSTLSDPQIINSNSRFYCYPNPMQNYTQFYFANDKEFIKQVKLNIFDMSMRKVSSLQFNSNFANSIYWNGTNFNGSNLKPGLYVCQLVIQYKSGKLESKSLKVIISD